MITTKRARAFLAALIAGALASCATEQLLPPSSVAPRALENPAALANQYALAPGDKVRVTVFGEEAMSGEFAVASNGGIAIPLVGEISAAGQSPNGVKILIENELIRQGLVVDPRVSAAVTEYRPYYILGEVTRPGQYAFAPGLTVSKAVATAGGFTYRANERIVYITREGSEREVSLALTAASRIGPGDTIRITERFF